MANKTAFAIGYAIKCFACLNYTSFNGAQIVAIYRLSVQRAFSRQFTRIFFSRGVYVITDWLQYFGGQATLLDKTKSVVSSLKITTIMGSLLL